MRKYVWSIFIVATLLFQSCETYKNVPYFKDVPDSVRLSVTTALYHELIIQPGDVLSVNIQTIDPDANVIFNQMPAATPTNAGAGVVSNITSTAPSGYIVNDSGIIEVPLIGLIKVSGLTTSIATDTIRQQVAELYKKPTVVVRLINLRVNVLGEVSRPGTYVMPNEKNTIFDALAQAGDLTIFGKRENALLIRDSAGQKNFIRFSLNSKDLVKQDFFYLKQNDALYIEPTKGKAASTDANRTRLLTLAGAAISLIIVFLARVKL